MAHDNILMHLPDSEATFDPCFAFSIHKCGSTLLHAMISEVCKRASVPAISIPDILFAKGISGAEWSSDLELVPIFGRRLLFYGFRYLPKVLLAPEVRISERKFVLLVRDPRDALVSQYFSYGKKAGSHRLPKQNAERLLKNLTFADDPEIDRYVLQTVGSIRNKMAAYRDEMNWDLGLVRRYEDIYFDKESFLREIFAHFGIPVDPRILAEVAALHDVRPQAEDETKHIRKGTPGDHKEKLRPETIALLNDKLRDVAAFYGYSL